MKLLDLRFTDEAIVYKGGHRAATLVRTPSGGINFAYHPDYQGLPIAQSLPTQMPPLILEGGVLPPFFSGLLPEGHRLTVLRNTLKTSLDDELTLLLAIGNDVPGDVQVVPAGTSPKSGRSLLDGPVAEADFRKLTNSVDVTGIAGVQLKASATMINTPVTTDAEHAILKISPADFPFLVENEALHLKAAAQLKIPVARHKIVQDRNGVTGLWVTRFDRENEKRLALEDAAQVMGIYPAKKYSVTAEEVTLALADHCAAPLIAKRNIYLQFIFAWLSGNGDLHAKNLSILQGADGRWNVAPVYDIPCTALYRDFTLALPVSGKTRSLRKRHWLAFASDIGLTQPVAERCIHVAAAACERIDLNALPLTGSPINGAERELRNRRAALAL